jgi:hypothetical protein
MTALSKGREARRDLAILDCLDARDAGDPIEYRLALEHLLDVDRRLKLEQQADNHPDQIPQTVDGMIAALTTAATIAEALK